MFILLINCPFDDVISESQRKGTAVLGDGEIFAGLLPEVVATGAGICDKALMRGQNRVAKGFFFGTDLHGSHSERHGVFQESVP